MGVDLAAPGAVRATTPRRSPAPSPRRAGRATRVSPPAQGRDRWSTRPRGAPSVTPRSADHSSVLGERPPALPDLSFVLRVSISARDAAKASPRWWPRPRRRCRRSRAGRPGAHRGDRARCAPRPPGHTPGAGRRARWDGAEYAAAHTQSVVVVADTAHEEGQPPEALLPSAALGDVRAVSRGGRRGAPRDAAGGARADPGHRAAPGSRSSALSERPGSATADDEPPQDHDPTARTPSVARRSSSSSAPAPPRIGQIFSQLQSMMQPYDGPLNWDVADDTARKTVAQQPDPSPAQKQTTRSPTPSASPTTGSTRSPSSLGVTSTAVLARASGSSAPPTSGRSWSSPSPRCRARQRPSGRGRQYGRPDHRDVGKAIGAMLAQQVGSGLGALAARR